MLICAYNKDVKLVRIVSQLNFEGYLIYNQSL